jgi:hypothetical protein
MRRALLLGLCLFACSRSGPGPYGLADAPEQRWRFEADETFDVDGTPAKCTRVADVILRSRPPENGTTEVELFVDRYYARTEGTPDGGSQFTISEKGLSVETPSSGRVDFGPGDKTPAGDTLLEMRAQPAATADVDANGDVLAPFRQSPHPVLTELALLDWLIFALPTRPPASESAWVARRTLPQTGRFNLGVEMPLRWERMPEAPQRVRASGSVTRESLAVAGGLVGRLALDATGEAELLPDGRVRSATLELHFDLVASDGTRVTSRHRIRASCTSCGAPAVNSPEGSSDSANEREGTPQQRHLDDLPDHGGVRRGL